MSSDPHNSLDRFRFRNNFPLAGFWTLKTAVPTEDNMGRSILLWLLGVPIPIIILIALFWH